MRLTYFLLTSILAIALTACGGVETRPAETDTFAAGNYKYYSWRSEPLVNTGRSSDVLYTLDPVVRAEVDATLRSKGYRLNPAKAQFSVDYIFAAGWRMGEKTSESSNLNHRPSAMINRQVDQAVVDNANALGGVKETYNIGLMFNDTLSNEEVWHVVITKIVENVNNPDVSSLRKNAGSAIRQGLKTLPEA